MLIYVFNKIQVLHQMRNGLIILGPCASGLGGHGGATSFIVGEGALVESTQSVLLVKGHIAHEVGVSWLEHTHLLGGGCGCS